MAENKEVADEMSFLEHLEALRWHIMRALIGVVIVAIIVFLSGKYLFDYIIFAPTYKNFPTYQLLCSIAESLCFSPEGLIIQQFQLGEEFITHIKVAFVLGLTISFPYVFYEFWKFIKPGLYDKEVKAARGIVLICSLLFISGVLFGYFVISPFAISFLSNYSISDIVQGQNVTITSYINYMIMFTLPAGIIFELPIVIYFLAKVGLVDAAFLKKYRKHAVVIILILASIITPPDIMTQILIGFPLYILFEISIVIAGRINKDEEDDQEKKKPKKKKKG